MMEELSLNILDIAQNSIAAEASLVRVEIEENDADDTLTIRIADDGKGMDGELLKTVESPFVTTRTTRKIGLGISFLKEAAELAGGSFKLESAPGRGTTVTAVFTKSHIDRQPMGDLPGTMTALISLNPGVDFHLRYAAGENEFLFTTQEVREILGEGYSPDHPSVAAFLTEYIKEQIDSISN